MPKYLIKLADKDTGAECMKEYAGRDRLAAQDKAIKDDWMLAEPKASRMTEPTQPKIEVSTLESTPSWRERYWNEKDPTERAVIRGVCKAYCLILFYTAFVLVVLAVTATVLYGLLQVATP